MNLAALEVVARGGGSGPRFLIPLLLLLILGFVGAKIVRHRRGTQPGGGANGSPMRLLQERFANGEIDRSEFEHRKAVLLGDEIVPSMPERPSDEPVEPPASSDDE